MANLPTIDSDNIVVYDDDSITFNTQVILPAIADTLLCNYYDCKCCVECNHQRVTLINSAPPNAHHGCIMLFTADHGKLQTVIKLGQKISRLSIATKRKIDVVDQLSGG